MDKLNLPINTAATVVASGVLAVTAYVIKKRSQDQQHLVDSHTEAKKVDAEMQSTMLNILKEMTSKTLV